MEPIRRILRPLPGIKQASLIRQRLTFAGSANYWERNYQRGGTSGAGSYGTFAEAKADFLNSFVRDKNIQSVIEFGCGDGHQLSLAIYPRYIGLDVSPAAIDLCKGLFAEDITKSFFLYDGGCFIDHGRLFASDMAVSLDVIYHLVEDEVFAKYMKDLFQSARLYVVIYATNKERCGTAPHVRHREFTSWVTDNCQSWHLVTQITGPNNGPDRADFFIYERLAREVSP
jgi:SAM-dependent methyltransferase